MFTTGKDSTLSTFYVTSSGVNVSGLSSLGNILLQWFSWSWSLGNVLEFQVLVKEPVKQLTSLNWFYLLKIDCWLITPWVIIQRKNYKCPRRNTWPQDNPGVKVFNLQNSEKRNFAPRAFYKVRRISIRKTWLSVTWVADMD